MSVAPERGPYHLPSMDRAVLETTPKIGRTCGKRDILARAAVDGRDCVVWTGRELPQGDTTKAPGIEAQTFLRKLHLQRGGLLADSKVASKDDGLHVQGAVPMNRAT